MTKKKKASTDVLHAGPVKDKKGKAKKNNDGLSEQEHGQAWERGEAVETALDESEKKPD